ncbi:MAG TPA: type II toxin-antitoxin system HicA family toxin [Thermoguttaceae bacterium]|nr:type II toxin-antitoxin system HicA family toxin [Thermoguttaceae bacterium]
MKRQALVRHLESHGCYLLREGGNHSVYVNPEKNQSSAVPRHREISDFLAYWFGPKWKAAPWEQRYSRRSTGASSLFA